MNVFYISWKNIKKKGLSSFLSILLIAFGVGLLSLLIQFNKQFSEQFEKNQAGIDLVVGAKGSPLQLILNSMFHVDAPTGNVKIEDAAFLFNPKNPFIKTAIPLSIGDSYKSYRIIGTTSNFLELYDAKINEGNLWAQALEVVVGSAVAKDLNLKIGSTFFSSHGFNEGDLEHDEGDPFIVVGILESSGTVADKIILTSTESIWEVHSDHNHSDEHNHEENAEDHEHNHEHHEHDDHDHEEHNHDHEDRAFAQNKGPDTDMIELSEIETLLQEKDKDITSVLVKFHADKKRSIPVINMPRNINENTPVMATAPSYELNKLLANVGAALQSISYLAILIAIISALSIFVSLFNNLKERQYELAMMRVCGGRPLLLSTYILCEAIIIGIIGFILGIILAHVALLFLSSMLDGQFHYGMSAMTFYKEELYLGLATILISLVAALIPSYKAYKTDIIKSLQ
jgi:putative ABC transport system permease protein